MHLKPLFTAAILGLAVIATSALANHRDHFPRSDQSRQHQVRIFSPYLAGGFGVGGDEVGRFEDSRGDIETVRSGGGLLLEGGLRVAVDPWSHLRFTAGYQADGVSRLNGDSVFERTRFDLTLLRSFGYHEFGVGVTAHTNINFRCDISSVCAGDVEFDPAVGFTVEYALRVASPAYYSSRGRGGYNSPALRLGLRYTGIEYTPALLDLSTNDVTNADTLMGFVGFSF